MLPGCGHMPMMAAVEAVAEELRAQAAVPVPSAP
jgi:hypothetical protein